MLIVLQLKGASRGIGVTGDFTSALDKPALLVKFDQDAYLSLNLEVLGSDQYDLVDRAEQVAYDIDQVIDDINNETATEEQVDSALNEVADLDGRLALLREGINLQALFPNNTMSWGVLANQYGKGGATINYEENDGDLIRGAFDNANTILAIKNNTIDITYPGVQADINNLLTALHLEQFNVDDLESIDLVALEEAVKSATNGSGDD